MPPSDNDHLENPEELEDDLDEITDPDELDDEEDEEDEEEEDSAPAAAQLTDAQINQLLQDPRVTERLRSAVTNLLPAETKGKPEQKVPLMQRIAAKMGTDMNLIPNTLWDAISEVVQEHLTPVAETVRQTSQTSVQSAVDAAYNSLRSDPKFADIGKFEQQMIGLMQRLPLAPGNTDYKTYIQDLYYLASGKSRSEPTEKEREKRRARLTAKNPPRGQTRGELSDRPPKTMTIRDAVLAAERKLQRK